MSIKPINIYIASRDNSDYGGGTHTRDIIHYLRKHPDKYNVKLITHKPVSEQIKIPTIHIPRFGPNFITQVPVFFFLALFSVRSLPKADLVILQHRAFLWPWVTCPVVSFYHLQESAMAKTLLQLPCFKFSHLITCLIGSFFYISQIIFEIYGYYTSTHVVFVSKKCQSLSPRTIQARSTILRHGITIPQTSLKNIAVQKRIELLYFGRMALNKGTYHLIHVLKNDKSLKYHITLIGSGNVPNSSKITHIQHLPHSELITSLPNYHVFVLPSFHEGFPYSLLEAMAAGMLVITTPISDVTEYLDDRQIAETPKDFPKKIANLMTLSQSERSTISKKNIQTVSEHFSSNSFEKNIEKIIKTFGQ